MRKVNRTWMAAVAAALLLGTLVGAVWARPNDRPQMAVTTRKVTIPAAFFYPAGDAGYYTNNGVWVRTDLGECRFNAPVIFPTLSSVTVKKITLSVTDNNAGYDACAILWRTSPKNLSEVQMASACSSGSGGTTNCDDSTIDNARVYPAHGPYVRLYIGGTDIAVYGVTIEYQINT